MDFADNYQVQESRYKLLKFKIPHLEISKTSFIIYKFQNMKLAVEILKR